MLWQLSACEAANKIRSGEITSIELVEACLERISETDGRIGAWAFLDRELALSQAEAMDELRRRGRALGQLHGVPVGIKDIFDTRDMPTAWGTIAHSDRRPTADAAVIDRLLEAGAVILGKTVTTPLAFASPSATRNPHNQNYSPGGSSAGSAAAVGAGHVPLAIGSQTNGSIIRPASYCGVYGFKPTRGVVSRRGCLQTSQTLDQVGVMGRTIADVAVLTDVLAAYDPSDAASFARPRPPMLAGYQADPPVEPCFVWLELPFYDRIPEAMRQGLEELIDALGDRVERQPAPASFMETLRHHQTVHEYEFLNNLKDDPSLQPDLIDGTLQSILERARTISTDNYNLGLAMVAGAEEFFASFFNDYDAIIAPSSLGGAPEIDGGTGDPICSTIWTFAGLPCLSLPWLTGETGLPAGVQLIGSAEEDDRLLRTTAWLERELRDDAGHGV